MIAYMPTIYPDELVYSWCSRYYAHSGFPSYSMTLEELFGDKCYRLSHEFSGCFTNSAKAIISKMIGMGELIKKHTMYAYYARFAPHARRTAAYEALISGQHIGKLLPIPTSTEARFLMYCPECAKDDRRTYGEAYMHRVHQIRHIGVCPYHGHPLRSTGIMITANTSPRLYVAEEVIPYGSHHEQQPKQTDTALARYMLDVHNQPIPTAPTTTISEYLTHRLRGTPYMSSVGTMRQIARLHRDMKERYTDYPYQEHNIQKVLLGNSFEPHLITLIAYHLGIIPQELCNGVVSSTNSVTEHPHTRARSSYSTRKGAQVQDWHKLDKDSLPVVRKAIKMLLVDSTGRPRRVTDRAVCQQMGWPDKRLEYLPMCKAEVDRYHETMPQYWAREVVWAYRKLVDGNTKLNWRGIRDLTNIRRCDFLVAQSLLGHYADDETCAKIKAL